MKLTRSHAMFAAMCLIWGMTWIAMKVGIAAVPPCLFAGTRFVAAGAALLAWLWWQGRPMRIARGHVPRMVAVTLLIMTGAYALLFWGTVYVNSGLAATLDMSLIPISLLTFGILLGEERFTLSRGFGIVLGVTGLVVLFGPKLHAGGNAGGYTELIGGGAIVASAFVYSLGSVLARPLLRAYPPALMAGVTMFGGGWVLLLGAVWLEPGAADALPWRWGEAAWAGWVFLVLFGSLVGYTIFLDLLKRWGPSAAGSYAFISPIVAVCIGAVWLGESMRIADAAAMAIMLTGAWFALRASHPN
jgi:drug/metabolite transporter (DMT)-like permease